MNRLETHSQFDRHAEIHRIAVQRANERLTKTAMASLATVAVFLINQELAMLVSLEVLREALLFLWNKSQAAQSVIDLMAANQQINDEQDFPETKPSRPPELSSLRNL